MAAVPEITSEVRDGVAIIAIDRPAKRNAMTYAMLDAFHAALAVAAADDAVCAVIVTGTGGAFCAGTDLGGLAELTPQERGSAATEESWRWPLVACPKPVIAAVDGPAVGMGADLVCQCDVRIASTQARFAWNFVHRGLVPDTGAGSWLLPRQVGLPAALRLLFSGAFLDADEALALGFVTEVVAPEDLMDRALELAASLSAGSPLAAALVKRLVYEGLARDHEDHIAAHAAAIDVCFRSEDHREGVAAFLERRSPVFSGRHPDAAPAA
jgi:enoyl-CoA hydratase/carnithine racemase